MPDIFICVPSYKRANNHFYAKIVKRNPEIASQVLYFVREEEYMQYKDAMPLISETNLIAIPHGWVTGVGSTREFIRKYMSGIDLKWYVISDDDITDITFVQYDAQRKAHYSGKNMKNTLSIIVSILNTLPENCALGTIQPRAFAKDFDRAVKIMETRSPSQFVIYNNHIVKQIPFNLELFNKHGDDIGYACQIVSAGHDYFQIPSVVYSCWDSTFSGILRTKENYIELFNKDYENARKYLPEECLGRSKNDYHFTYIKPRKVLEWRKRNEHNT